MGIWILIIGACIFVLSPLVYGIAAKKQDGRATLLSKRSQFIGAESRFKLKWSRTVETGRDYYCSGFTSRCPRFTLFYGVFEDEHGAKIELQMPYAIYENMKEGSTVRIQYRRNVLWDAEGFDNDQTIRRKRRLSRVISWIMTLALLSVGTAYLYQDNLRKEERKAELKQGIRLSNISGDEARPLLEAMGFGAGDARIVEVIYRQGVYGPALEATIELPSNQLGGFLADIRSRYTKVEGGLGPNGRKPDESYVLVDAPGVPDMNSFSVYHSEERLAFIVATKGMTLERGTGGVFRAGKTHEK